jgi:hypothetical protein
MEMDTVVLNRAPSHAVTEELEVFCFFEWWFSVAIDFNDSKWKEAFICIRLI